MAFTTIDIPKEHFNVITYTGNGVDGANIAHGLSGAWDCVWIKNRGTTDDWQIYHKYQQLMRAAYLL